MSFARRVRTRNVVPALIVLMSLAGLTACGGGGTGVITDSSAQALGVDGRAQILSASEKRSKDDDQQAGSGTPTTQPASTEGRLLASNCFQCHGTLGRGGFDRIRGGEANEVLEFTTKAAGGDIMAAHAQGYTPEQLQKIIAYLQQ